MLPPPISQPFKTISYCVVRISPIFFLFNKSSIYSDFGEENGLCVNVHFPLSIFSKKGKSTTQQKANSRKSFLFSRKSGLSVPYFFIAISYVIGAKETLFIF